MVIGESQHLQNNPQDPPTLAQKAQEVKMQAALGLRGQGLQVWGDSRGQERNPQDAGESGMQSRPMDTDTKCESSCR